MNAVRPRSALIALGVGVGAGLLLAVLIVAANESWSRAADSMATPVVPIAVLVATGLLAAGLLFRTVPAWTVLGAGGALLAGSLAFWMGASAHWLLRISASPVAYALAGVLIGAAAIRFWTRR